MHSHLPSGPSTADALLAQIVDSSADLIAACDLQLRLTACNPAYDREHRRVWGRSPTLGMDAPSALPVAAGGWEASASLWRRALSGETFPVHAVMSGPSGKARSYDVLFHPLRDESGEVVGAFHVARRIGGPSEGNDRRRLRVERTRRRSAERRLQEMEERRTLAVAATGIGEWDYDPATRRLTWPARVGDLIGVSPEEPAGFHAALERIHPEDRRRLIDSLAAALDPGGSGQLRVEFRAVHPEGRVVWIHARGRTTFEEGPTGRRPVLLRGAALDITQQKEVERELREAKDAAERASEAKSRFLATISHELRTPLTTVIGLADLMGSEVLGPMNDHQRERLARLKTAAWHQGAIIDEILTFSRAEADKLEVTLQRVDVAQIVRSVAEVIEPQAEAKGLALESRGADRPVVVRTDGGKLRQITQNLVGNAVKFSETGRVDIELETTDRWVVLTVRDTGIGIPEPWRERIFEPFTQVDGSSTRSSGGTGLGLAVVRKLVDVLGGEISVESEAEAGSRFTVRVPRDTS